MKMPSPTPSTEHSETQSDPTTEAIADCEVAPLAAGPVFTGPLVAECIDCNHPTLRGRVLVAWTDAAGRSAERWVPTVQGLPIRAGDRVLLIRPENWAEPIVTGVVDGFARRPEIERTDAATLRLQGDERVRIDAADGQPIAELHAGAAGPVIRLMHADVDLELPGALRIRASKIELEARQGACRIKASDDVVVEGETIQLN
jgi:hypothetical protein